MNPGPLEILSRIGAELGFDARFNTLGVLLVFLPVTIAGYWWIPPGRPRWAWLTAASLVFYSFWDVRFASLLILSSVVDFVLARRMVRTTDQKSRRRYVIATVAFNLGLLGVFKYAVFATGNVRSLFSLLGLDVTLPYFHIVLPVGISFYTFQTMSYTIDVYRRHVEPTRDLIQYMAYVTMFPQLVAGPIVRYRTVQGQLTDSPRRPLSGVFVAGLVLFMIGLSKKVIVADTVASTIDPLWADASALAAVDAWSASLGYTIQLYFDFSGYSDMALGLGAMLGMRFPINFDAPYQATDPSDFWRRWHISLSTFLRDYLYVPLGGNRVGPIHTYANLFIVMLLGGLWHGAAWTFILWGTYHGILLGVHRRWREPWDRLPRAVRRAIMLALVTVGWVLFRAPDLATALDVLAALIGMGAHQATATTTMTTVVALLAVLAATTVLRPAVRWRLPTGVGGITLATVLFWTCLLLLRSQDSPFLYYQF